MDEVRIAVCKDKETKHRVERKVESITLLRKRKRQARYMFFNQSNKRGTADNSAPHLRLKRKVKASKEKIGNSVRGQVSTATCDKHRVW